MTEAIRQRARELGFDLCGITTASSPKSAPRLHQWLALEQHGEMGYLARNAHKRSDPQQVLPGVKSVVVVAVSYGEGQAESEQTGSSPQGKNEPAAPRGLVARYARFSDYHDVLKEPLKQLASFLNQLGPEGTRSLWYSDTGPILERDFAQRAGVGFVGKHTNLISRKLGNWILLGEVLTTLELEPDRPESNRCGSCSRCISACPTAAITAPFQLDARRCISYLTIELKAAIPVEWRPAIGNRIFGCDDCLAACPWNRFAADGALMKAHSRPDLATPDLLQLLAIDDAEFKRRFAETPLLRVKRRGLLRNVCVALGNVGDQSALPALARVAAEADPLVAEHANWATDQIRKRFQ
jgi:epoxyqueuosine reductase